VRPLIGKILTTLKLTFDYVIVDTPPAFDDQVLEAFDESDLLLLLVTPDAPALKNLRITLEMLELLNYPRQRSRVVLNRAGANVGITSDAIEKTLKSEIFATIPAAHEVPASINRGQPIVTSVPRHPASEALLALARDADSAISGTRPDSRPSDERRDVNRRRLFSAGGSRRHKSRNAARLRRG